MKYKIEITETLQKTIEVEADNIEDALLKVKHQYRKEEIILDDTSYIDTEFKVVE
jgi:hypothetical protein